MGDLMVNSSAVKRKRSPVHSSPEKLAKESDAGDVVTVDASVEKELVESDVQIVVKSEKKVVQVLKKKKKKGAPAAKKSLKKRRNTKKKSFSDDQHFDIDPRLGGSKIKQTVTSKMKDKKCKSSEYETKRSKVYEQRYPYIHVEGAWNLPTTVKIINGHVKEDDSEGKFIAKVTKAAQYVDDEHRIKAAKVGFTSTLSDKYDTHNRDVSWVFIFCQQYTHMQCLGDLYGPYYINEVRPEPIWFSKKNPDTRQLINELEASPPAKPGSKKSKKSQKKRNSLTKTDSEIPSATVPVSTVTEEEVPIDDIHQESNEKKEVWFHESCLIWAPGVCLVPPRLVGLDEAISDSHQVVCDHCQKRGGHIFCRQRGCGTRAHYPCAVAHHWLLQEDEFLAFCPAHFNQHVT